MKSVACSLMIPSTQTTAIQEFIRLNTAGGKGVLQSFDH